MEQSVAVRTRAYADKVDHKIKNSQNFFLSELFLICRYHVGPKF